MIKEIIEIPQESRVRKKFVKDKKIDYIEFIECELRGKWYDVSNAREVIEGEGDEMVDYFRAEGDNCEVWIVRPDGLRRAWIISLGKSIRIRNNILRFNKNSISDEIAVDEQEQRVANRSSKVI